MTARDIFITRSLRNVNIKKSTAVQDRIMATNTPPQPPQPPPQEHYEFLGLYKETATVEDVFWSISHGATYLSSPDVQNDPRHQRAAVKLWPMLWQAIQTFWVLERRIRYDAKDYYEIRTRRRGLARQTGDDILNEELAIYNRQQEQLIERRHRKSGVREEKLRQAEEKKKQRIEKKQAENERRIKEEMLRQVGEDNQLESEATRLGHTRPSFGELTSESQMKEQAEEDQRIEQDQLRDSRDTPPANTSTKPPGLGSSRWADLY